MRAAAPWRTQRLSHWDVIGGIRAKGKPISPLLQAPWVNVRIFRIDWLHVVDLGVAADYLGNLFTMFIERLPGGSKEARLQVLWERMLAFYDREGIQDKLQNLTLGMIQGKKAPPKLRCSAAQCRALIPFALEMSQSVLGASPVEEAAKCGMVHLGRCYTCLSSDTIFAKDMFEDSATKFAAQYIALEAASEGLAWRVKPKLHLLLELFLEGGRPATCWTYRDEDFGGSVAGMARRRGGLLSCQAFSNNLIDRIRMQPPMIRMRK